MPISDRHAMRLALRLAALGLGQTSPNPLVGAVLVKGGKVIGRGWHRQAGGPHAEIEAINNAIKRGANPAGSILYVTMEPCSTHGRTPPCTDAILAHGIGRVVVGAVDPNPRHCGQGLEILRHAGLGLCHGVEALAAVELNASFNHWIVHRTPHVTVKAAMTLDGKIATASGESKWITSEPARLYAMKLRREADAILVGVNTVLADDPKLTVRGPENSSKVRSSPAAKELRRIILDPNARTPLSAQVLSDENRALTTIVASPSASPRAVARLRKRVRVIIAPLKAGTIDLRWLLRKLGKEEVCSLLVEGGGETNALFLSQRMVQRVAFFYAPKIVGGRDARKAVAGKGARISTEALALKKIKWRRLGPDLLLTAEIK